MNKPTASRDIQLRAGWLPARDRLPRTHLNGVAFRRDLPTRWEEFAFVWQTLQWVEPRPTILDAGSGFDPTCHVLPQILAAGGFPVTALDAHPDSLHMPPCDGVTRVLGDITQLDLPDQSVSVYVSVSVLEHLDPGPRWAAFQEAKRVLHPGGLLIVTMDEINPGVLHDYTTKLGLLCGTVVPLDGDPLIPAVAYVVAQKPA